MNEKEAELIGMHAGDGTLYLAGKTLVWELRGSVNEKPYYEYVKNLLKELFGVDVNPKYRGPTSYGIQTTNKILTQFFIKNGFNPGTKVYTVRIPDYVKSANKNIKLSFIRGLFDTDGCLRFEKNRTKFRYYPRIEFSFASENMNSDLFSLLKELGFRVYMWPDRKYSHLGLAGFDNLEKWLKEVKPANSKHMYKASIKSLKSAKSHTKLCPDGTAVTPADC